MITPYVESEETARDAVADWKRRLTIHEQRLRSTGSNDCEIDCPHTETDEILAIAEEWLPRREYNALYNFAVGTPERRLIPA